MNWMKNDDVYGVGDTRSGCGVGDEEMVHAEPLMSCVFLCVFFACILCENRRRYINYIAYSAEQRLVAVLDVICMFLRLTLQVVSGRKQRIHVLLERSVLME